MNNPAIRIPEHVVSREVGGETVILNLESGTYFGLNAVGSRIWSGIMANDAPARIQAAVAKEFGVAEAQVERDMTDLIHQLLATGLAQQVPG